MISPQVQVDPQSFSQPEKEVVVELRDVSKNFGVVNRSSCLEKISYAISMGWQPMRSNFDTTDSN